MKIFIFIGLFFPSILYSQVYYLGETNQIVKTLGNEVISYSAGLKTVVSDTNTFVSLQSNLKFLKVKVVKPKDEFIADQYTDLSSVVGWYKVVPLKYSIEDGVLSLKVVNPSYIDLNEFYTLQVMDSNLNVYYPIENERWHLPFYDIKYPISKDSEIFTLITSEEELNFENIHR